MSDATLMLAAIEQGEPKAVEHPARHAILTYNWFATFGKLAVASTFIMIVRGFNGAASPPAVEQTIFAVVE